MAMSSRFFKDIIQIKPWSFSSRLIFSPRVRSQPPQNNLPINNINSLAKPLFLTMSTQLLDLLKKDDKKETPVPTIKYVR